PVRLYRPRVLRALRAAHDREGDGCGGGSEPGHAAAEPLGAPRPAAVATGRAELLERVLKLDLSDLAQLYAGRVGDRLRSAAGVAHGAVGRDWFGGVDHALDGAVTRTIRCDHARQPRAIDRDARSVVLLDGEVTVAERGPWKREQAERRDRERKTVHPDHLTT